VPKVFFTNEVKEKSLKKFSEKFGVVKYFLIFLKESLLLNEAVFI